MKLYTEYNLKEVYFKGLYNGKNHIQEECHNAIDSQTPIELPSDEEIVVNACKNPIVDDFMNDRQIGFVKGCKWMKQQILNQNK